ncbi:MAG: rubrerythrin family protein [Candidatus Thorarchaeota archaeon]|nr:MAG: rubrerythrin family protein [Candidatus Thorarchaeota archaeon]
MSGALDRELRKRVIASQRQEITEYVIYSKLAESAKDEENRRTLKKLADDELDHYNIWKSLTGEDVKPKSSTVRKHMLYARLFGLTFSLKLMENGEKKAEKFYQTLSEQVPQALAVVDDETKHENQLVELINEERLKYVSAIVLGLNDALVELTGALAGFTFALQDAKLVAMTGLITGIAASLSMGSSEYLSTKSEGGEKSPRKAATYTTIAYILTVFALVVPFIVLNWIYLSLLVSIASGILVLFVFTFYISVAKSLPFRRRFLETASISLGVAALTFMLGLLVRVFFGLEI